MDEKKVREAIELMNKLKKHTDIWFGVSPVLEGKDKKAKECFDIAIEALEKQLPAKADIMDYTLGDINFRCPICKSEYICEKEHEHFYCPNCGQKLDWSE